VGPGTPRSISLPNFTLSAVRWSPDGGRLVVAGHAAGRPSRCWVLDLAGGKLRPVTAEGVTADRSSLRLSPDGRYLTAAGPDGKLALYPLKGGEPRPIAGLRKGELPLRWTADGKALFVARRTGLPFRIDRLDLATGDREPWKEFHLDPAGLVPRSLLHITPDGRSYVYNSQRVLTDLYLADGLR
jgi:Tol biopolymer transport system component